MVGLEHVEVELMDYKKERELRRKECIAQLQLDIEKFKMMLNAFMQTNKCIYGPCQETIITVILPLLY